MVQIGIEERMRWRCPVCYRERGNRYHANTRVTDDAARQSQENARVFLNDADLTLYQGDCLEVLRDLPSASAQVCATSPPFYGLRDYQAEGQIGLEDNIQEWVERLCDVFDEVRRVLRDDGTCWIEIGDSFSEKQLVGQPWRLAFALQERGWWLRSEIIWARPNPMPESISDRPTKAHSTIFLLSKQQRYFYDADAIREEYAQSSLERSRYLRDDIRSGTVGDLRQTGEKTLKGGPRRGDLPKAPPRVPQVETLDGSAGESQRGPDGRRVTVVKGGEHSEQHRDGERWPNPAGANARSVWIVPTEATPFAHFATWPKALVRRMILAGCPENGVVLDPFAGSGTTLLVARSLGRRSIGIELNADYCKLVAERTQQLSLLAEGGGS